MILHSLVKYYDRKFAIDGGKIAPEGFEYKEIPFVFVLSVDGRLIQIQDTRESKNGRSVSKRFNVPQAVKRSSGIRANLLWDNAGYVLGIGTNETSDNAKKKLEAFQSRIYNDLNQVIDDEGIQAVLRFLEHREWKSVIPEVTKEIEETNPNISFKLLGDSTELIVLRSNVLATIQSQTGEKGIIGRCLVSGAVETVARLHPPIKGVWGAQSSGANIVSFNHDAFTSYGKEQGYNAPVGKTAAFKYTTALNHLLREDSNQRMQVGDTSTVFWSEGQGQLEKDLASIFTEPRKDNPDAYTSAIRSLFSSIRNGAYVAPDANDRFYIFGLSPNAARISIRFWHVGTVAQIGQRIYDWFNLDLDMVGPEKVRFPPLGKLLKAVAVQNEVKNIPPNLAGESLRCILEGLPLPLSLLHAAIHRIRAERSVSYERAVLVKAFFNRQIRFSRSTNSPFPVALDPEHPNPGYQLGRLFAVFEKIQTDASPGLSSTIRDRYYGSASSTPASVFPILLKLKNHHLSKIENPGYVAGHEKRLREIFGRLSEFPKQLNLPDQGAFAIGYYHQMRDFFVKKDSGTSTSSSNNL